MPEKALIIRRSKPFHHLDILIEPRRCSRRSKGKELRLPSLSGATEGPPVEQVMEEVAANQDRAQELRREFVYRQDLMVRLTRGNKKLVREELRELQVTPTPGETEKTLVRLQGKYEKDGKMLEYGQLGFRPKSVDLDGELIDSFAEKIHWRQEIARRNLARFLPVHYRQTE